MMARLAALALLLGTTWVVVLAGGPADAGTRVVALAIGLALVSAVLVGELFETLRLPRITGYLIFGLLAGPSAADLITRPMARELQVVNSLAVALIAFVAGLEFNLAAMRPRLGAILRFSGTALAAMYAGLFAVTWLAWPWLPIEPAATGLARAVLAALTATILVSFSPAVTIAVIADSRSRGPLTELSLAVVILADLALIVAFTLVMQAARAAIGGADLAQGGTVERLIWETAGSVALGAAIGAVFALYLHWVRREVTLALLGACALIGQLGGLLHVEPLIVALAAGFVVENVAPPEGEALRRAIERGAQPVLVVFFAAAGASLQLDALATLGVVAVALVVARAGLIWGGAQLASRASGMTGPPARLVWTALVSQAGVVLGLTVIVAGQFPTWGGRLQSLVVAAVAVNQLAGPLLFKWALAAAGEAGQAHLERLREAAPAPATDAQGS